MYKCTFWGDCPFFSEMMQDMPLASDRLRKVYCNGKFTECARYMVYSKLGKQAVPYDLYPSMVTRAQMIIEKGGEDDIDLDNIHFDPLYLENLPKHVLVKIIMHLKNQ